MCWIFHSLDVWKMDHRFLAEWAGSAEPRVILNYRDPRDTLLSLVNFLSGEGKQGFFRFPESQVFAPVLAVMPNLTEQLRYAMTDPAVPFAPDFEKAISFFHHPRVCNVAFEELVGRRGGGTQQAQLEAVARITDFLGLDADPGAVASALYDPDSFTFHRGRIGRWREAFDDEVGAMFDSRFSRLPDVFGHRA